MNATAVNDIFHGWAVSIIRNPGQSRRLRAAGLHRYEMRMVVPAGQKLKPGYESLPTMVGYGRTLPEADLHLAQQLMDLVFANGDGPVCNKATFTFSTSDTASNYTYSF